MKLRFTAKCSDCFGGQILDDEGNVLKELDGYVPENLGIGGGDYIEMTVDLTTGQIEDFEIDMDELKESFLEYEEDDDLEDEDSDDEW